MKEKHCYKITTGASKVVDPLVDVYLSCSYIVGWLSLGQLWGREMVELGAVGLVEPPHLSLPDCIK